MTSLLKQSTAVTVKIGPFVDDSDGKTAESALTITQADVRLSKNGGNMAQKNESSACTHDEIGYYDCPLSTTDTNTLGRLKLMVHESGALPVWHDFMVVPAAVFDAVVSGSGNGVRADVQTMAAAATGQVTDAVLDEALSGHAVAGSVGEALSTAGDYSVSDIVDGVLDEALAGHGAAGTVGEALGSIGDPFAGTNAEVSAGAEPTTHAGLLRMIYNRFYRRAELTDSTLNVYQKNAAGGSSGVLTSQTVSDDGTTQIQQQSTYPS